MEVMPETLGDLVTIRARTDSLDFEKARQLAREEARRLDPRAMLLSWHSGLTGEYQPKISCGPSARPPWIVWAASRGANLTVSVNDGDFCFYYLIDVLADPQAHRRRRSVP